jgi:putative Holliday junction resolvase
MQKGKILGLDWGSKRIGVAISDFDQQIVFGKESIENKSKKHVIDVLSAIINENEVIGVILGYPVNLEGEKTKSTVKVEKFKALLDKHLKVPVILHDERLTSVESGSIITSFDIKTKDKKKETDIIAASLILKNYLESNKGKNKG